MVFDKIFKLRGQSVFKNLQVKEYIVMTAHNLKALHSNPDSNRTRTHNLLVCKRTLNHLAKLAKQLSRFVNTYLYGACACMLLLCHVPVSE